MISYYCPVRRCRRLSLARAARPRAGQMLISNIIMCWGAAGLHMEVRRQRSLFIRGSDYNYNVLYNTIQIGDCYNMFSNNLVTLFTHTPLRSYASV